MLTPTRFRDSDDPLMRDLLASAEQDNASSVSRARVAQGLGLGALASNAPSVPPESPGAAGAARHMPSRSLRLGPLQKYLLVGLGTGLTVVAGWRLTMPPRSNAPEQLPNLSASTTSVATPNAPLPSAPLPSAPLPSPSEIQPPAVEPSVPQPPPVARHSDTSRVTSPRTPALARAARTPARPGAVVPAPAPRQSDTLLAQVAQLDRARAALRDQHAAKAITELDAYVATFPNAELALEAEVLRVHALIAAREPSAAAALAGRLLERPGSEQYRAELRRAIAVTRRESQPHVDSR